MAIPKDFIDPNRSFPDSGEFMERGMLQFLQALFSTFPPGSNFHWDENPEERELEIMGKETDNLEKTDTRPKIVVYRGPMQWEGRSLGNMVGSQNLSIAKRQYADINDGTISINSFSREGLESDRLSNICYMAIKQFRPVLQKFGFLMIHSSSRGARAKIKAGVRPELYVTPVLVSVQVTSNWSNTVVDPVKLREILIQLSVNT